MAKILDDVLVESRADDGIVDEKNADLGSLMDEGIVSDKCEDADAVLDDSDDVDVPGASFTTLDEYLEAGYESFVEANKGCASVIELLDTQKAALLRKRLLDKLNATIQFDRRLLSKDDVKKLAEVGVKPLSAVPNGIAARAILDTGGVALLTTPSSSSGCLIVKRYEDGQFSGVWQIVNEKATSDPVRAMAVNLLGNACSDSDVRNVISKVKDTVSNPMYQSKYLRLYGWNNKLVPCFNGVYDGRDHSFTPYVSPEFEKRYGRCTFTNKLDTAYNPLSCVPPKDFDPLAYIRSLSEDDEKGDAQHRLLLQFMQFAIRRFSGGEGWIVFLNNVLGKAAGHNGKSTFLQFLTFLIEHDSAPAYSQRDDARYYFSNGQKIVTLSIDQWGDRFSLGSVLMTMWMLVSDELKTGGVIKNTGVMKNLARRNRLNVEAKFKDQFSGSFPGVAAHAGNDYVILETKDDASLTHRIDFSFEKDFSGEDADVDIKNTHIVREDVAEYMLHYLLDEMDFANDYAPKDLAMIAENTEDVRRANVPSWRFFDEVFPQLSSVPELPSRIVYEMYYDWCRNEGQQAMSLYRFQKDLADYCKRHSDIYDYSSGLYVMKQKVREWIDMQHISPLKSYYRDKSGRNLGYVEMGENGCPTGKMNTDWLKGVQYQAHMVFKACPFWSTEVGQKIAASA